LAGGVLAPKNSAPMRGSQKKKKKGKGICLLKKRMPRPKTDVPERVGAETNEKGSFIADGALHIGKKGGEEKGSKKEKMQRKRGFPSEK